MLVSRRRGQLHLVTQPDHAALAGDLASWCGNERFPAAGRADSLLMAARRHDDGLRSRFEADMWHAYEILQAVDLLSPALCLIDLEAPTGDSAPPLPVPVTLRGVEQAEVQA